MTKYIGNFFKNKVKFVDNFFEKHFIDMSFRMLFHSHCIEKNRLSCRKVKFKKERIYTYILCLILKRNTIYREIEKQHTESIDWRGRVGNDSCI